jgi:hypothetical protein
MTALRDLTGQKFGRLLVIERYRCVRGPHPAWSCLCDCGRTHIVTGNNLVRARVKSCGCARVAANQARRRKEAA